jgi:hypothetical protein
MRSALTDLPPSDTRGEIHQHRLPPVARRMDEGGHSRLEATRPGTVIGSPTNRGEVAVLDRRPVPEISVTPGAGTGS